MVERAIQNDVGKQRVAHAESIAASDFRRYVSRRIRITSINNVENSIVRPQFVCRIADITVAMTTKLLTIGGLIYLVVAATWVVQSGVVRDGPEILHVACDPTRELWADVNAHFVENQERETGTRWHVNMSHGGSSSQARAVIDGLPADFVSLALWSDTDAVRKAGLIDAGWVEKHPYRSLPYFSTIVFVVRKGNPKGVRDWPDLVTGDVKIVTPNPKTSGNGKWSVLAAWGACLRRGLSEADADAYLKELFRRVPVLDTSARNATATFASKKRGDVHLTWENEAVLEVAESAGELEIVYPSCSVRAEPHVAVVDAVVRRRGTAAVVDSYVEYLYTDEAQHLIAKHHHRPSNPAILAKYGDKFPNIALFPATDVAPTWDEIQAKFFAENAAFDRWMRN